MERKYALAATPLQEAEVAKKSFDRCSVAMKKSTLGQVFSN